MVAVVNPPMAGALRRLLWGRGVSALGDGLWFTIWVLYFTRVVGLPATVVGVGMAVGGGCGLLASLPLGALADRFDPRSVLVALTVVRGLAMAGYLLVHDDWTFVAVTVVFVAFAGGGNAVRTALIAGLIVENELRFAVLARQRVAQHVGYAVGAGAGALVLSVDRPSGYAFAIFGNALSFFLLAAVTARLPRPCGGVPARRVSARVALRDRPYLAVVAVTSVLSLCWAMLSTGLPLWISHSTRLPLALSGAVVVISSVGIAALQVPATKFARTAKPAARTAVWSAAALAASCLLLATTSGAVGVAGIVVVIVAALLHVTGELGYVAAGWGLSVGLMREDARGAYQGMAEAATATVQMFAPAVFTFALGSWSAGGWVVVAALFLTAGSGVPVLTGWALRTR